MHGSKGEAQIALTECALRSSLKNVHVSKSHFGAHLYFNMFKVDVLVFMKLDPCKQVIWYRIDTQIWRKTFPKKSICVAHPRIGEQLKVTSNTGLKKKKKKKHVSNLRTRSFFIRVHPPALKFTMCTHAWPVVSKYIQIRILPFWGKRNTPKQEFRAVLQPNFTSNFPLKRIFFWK